MRLLLSRRIARMLMNIAIRLVISLLLCLSGATDAYKQVSGHPSKVQLRSSLVGSSQSLYNASFQQPLFRVPQIGGPASAIAGSMNNNLFRRFVRRDTCANLQNCASLSDGGTGKCCGPSDASWCCGENDNCGPGDGNYCETTRATCASLSNCVNLSDGKNGRCCAGSNGAGDWCCGTDNLCGDGVDGNYCTWVV